MKSKKRGRGKDFVADQPKVKQRKGKPETKYEGSGSEHSAKLAEDKRCVGTKEKIPIRNKLKQSSRKSTARLQLARPLAIETRDVFVKKDKLKLPAYKHRVMANLQRGEGAIAEIHGAGAAIQTACEIALWAVETADFPVITCIKTDTAEAIDEVKDNHSNKPFSYSKRPVSSILIRLTRG